MDYLIVETKSSVIVFHKVIGLVIIKGLYMYATSVSRQLSNTF